MCSDRERTEGWRYSSALLSTPCRRWRSAARPPPSGQAMLWQLQREPRCLARRNICTEQQGRPHICISQTPRRVSGGSLATVPPPVDFYAPPPFMGVNVPLLIAAMASSAALLAAAHLPVAAALHNKDRLTLTTRSSCCCRVVLQCRACMGANPHGSVGRAICRWYVQLSHRRARRCRHSRSPAVQLVGASAVGAAAAAGVLPAGVAVQGRKSFRIHLLPDSIFAGAWACPDACLVCSCS